MDMTMDNKVVSSCECCVHPVNAVTELEYFKRKLEGRVRERLRDIRSAIDNLDDSLAAKIEEQGLEAKEEVYEWILRNVLEVSVI